MILLVCSFTSAQSITDDFSGIWKTNKGDVIIQKRENVFTATSISKNKIVIKNLKFTNKQWQGIIVRPGNGEELSCKVSIVADKLEIVVKKSFFTKTLLWTKKER